MELRAPCPEQRHQTDQSNQTQNPALQNEAVWLTQLRLSKNMNIEKMNARTPPRRQGNVEEASTLTDAESLSLILEPHTAA